jgi:subtilisin-like proprotein convertase family protein
MKLTVAFLTLGLLANAAAQTNYYVQTVNTPVPDDNPTGLTSSIDVSGSTGLILDITVGLNISGGANGDLYAFLTHGPSSFAVLLNRVGKTEEDPFGYDDAGFSILLNEYAALDIHNYGGNGGAPITGIWQPDGRYVDPQLVLDTDARTATLSSFTNQFANGTWTLFVSDLATSRQSTLQSWSLTISTAVPEAATAQLAAVGAGLLLTRSLRRRWFRAHRPLE